LQLAIAMATGKPWAGFKSVKPSKVLVLNTEDDRDEMNRRIVATCDHMNIRRSELNGRLFVVDMNDREMVMVQRDPKTKEITETGLSDLVIDICRREGIDVVVGDPLVETHNLSENDETDAKKAAIVAP
jgi:RecA-family ATPase